MRLVLPAIELLQTKDTDLYMTKLTVNQIKELVRNKQLIPDTYNPDINIQQGYQRSLDQVRMRKIHNFLESKFKMVLPVMPTSIVLSVRKKPTEPLTFEGGQLIVGDDAVLYVVDGQHRVWGMKDHKNGEYEVPTTVIYGMDEHQEAAQFLVINSTQKKVDPSLQLRVLYYAEEKLMERLISEIKNVIPWQSWKLEALRIAIALENDPENPWYKKVQVPNETSDAWKPIKEGSFVDSFRVLASEGSTIANMPIDRKIAHLKKYWNTIKKLWSRAFEEDNSTDYLLTAHFGAGVFNTLFPSIMTLCSVTDSSTEELLQPIAKKYPLKSWARRGGRLSKLGSSQGVFGDTAEDFVFAINPRLDYTNRREYDNVRTKRHNVRWLADKAYEMLSPLSLKPRDQLDKDLGRYKKACYVLVNLKDSGKVTAYVGHSQSIEDRLRGHNKDYNLYHVESCTDEQEMKQLEATLWHLVKESVRENDVHPNKDYCPFCE